jgi:signal transduction histidine kinase
MLTINPDAPLFLVVEDDYSHAELIKRSFEDAPEEYRIEIANSLTTARKAIERYPPGLVLTDYRLPDGEGSELVAIVSGRCPVILLTSQGNERVAVDAMKAGVQDYVVKSTAVFSDMARIAKRSLREWTLLQDQKKAEEERLRLERQFLQIQKLESLLTMSGGIAHDFNNLLQAVLGNLELSLMRLPEDSPVRRFIGQAVLAAEKAAKLSGMMLSYSGKGLFSIGELSLTGLIEKNAAMLEAALPKSITLNLNLDDTLPLIFGDEEQIQQVVMNLIINASEAIGTVNGSITVATGRDEFDLRTLSSRMLEEKLLPGQYAWIEICDSGCGMDSETVHKVFDPFFTTKFTGRGLGMSAAQGIVRAHKGGILIDSSPGNGTTVRILFPIAAGALADSVADNDVSSEQRNSGIILIIDDEEIIRDVCSTMLEELGYTALTAACGEEGLRIFREQNARIRLVMLDHSMPGMDGVAVFDELRKISPDIRVLLASGYSEEELAERFTGLGLNGFLQKPFKLNVLESLLQRVLQEG